MGKSKLGEGIIPADVVYGVDPGQEGGVVRWVPGERGLRPCRIWGMARVGGLLASAASRATLHRMVVGDLGELGRVRAVIEWTTVVAARSSRSSMLAQGANVGRVAGWFEAWGAEVWFVEPGAWRAVMEVRTPEREPVASLKKADKEALGDAEAVAAFRKARRAVRATEAKVLLLEAGLARLKGLYPWWTETHEGLIDAALIGLAETKTTSRVGWRRL